MGLFARRLVAHGVYRLCGNLVDHLGLRGRPGRNSSPNTPSGSALHIRAWSHSGRRHPCTASAACPPVRTTSSCASAGNLGVSGKDVAEGS